MWYMGKLWYMSTMEIYTAEKKELLPFGTDSIDGTGKHFAK